MTYVRTLLFRWVCLWGSALGLSCGGPQPVSDTDGDEQLTNGSVSDDCEDLRYADPPSDQGLTPPPDVVQPGDDPYQDCAGDE